MIILTWECLNCGTRFEKPNGNVFLTCPNCDNKNLILFQYIGEYY